tara:strand:+ start:9685 stop:10077 length:393 start_codon:yes stop_codon:yes gene_type:complete
MKKIILSSLLIISFGFSLMAQNASTEQLDKALEVKFSEKQIEQLTKDNPKELDYLRYCVYNAYYITDLPKEKLQTSPERIKKIKLNDLENINFFTLDITILDNDYQYFEIEGSDKLLVVKSRKHIENEIK